MGSFSDSIFGLWGSMPLMKFHGDQSQIAYQLEGQADLSITAILGVRDYVTVIDEDGLTLKRHRWRIVINRDVNATTWEAIDMPQFKGRFVIDGDTWALDDTPGEGVRNLSPNFCELSLTMVAPITRTHAQHHERLN